MTYFINNEWGKNQYQNLSNARTKEDTTLRSIITSLIVVLCMGLFVLLFWDVSRHAAKTHVFMIDATQPVLHRTSKRFLSIGLDSSLLTRMKEFPLKDERFVNLAQHLSPAYVRFGGTMADCLFFNKTISSVSMDATKSMDGNDKTNFTITDEDFLELYKFTQRSNLRMMFDLNVLIRRPNGDWDDNNAQDIIRFAKANDMQLDWQLGNEPNSFPHSFGRTVTAQQLAKDYYTLRGLLILEGFQSSILVGPEVNHIGDPNHKGEIYAQEFHENDGYAVDYLTWHQYYLNGATARLQDFIDPSTFDYLPRQIDGMNAAINGTGRKIKMWLSETSTAYGSGAPELSDRYVAGFLWLDKLGYSAAAGIAVVVRQSFFGGNYAMVSSEITPNPDWWVSVFYKQFVSEKVLRLVTADNCTRVRLYAHCTPESALISKVPAVTVYGMNLDDAPVKISIQNGPSLRSKTATVLLYVLTSDHLQSREIQLNGETLRLKADGSLPPFMATISDLSQTIHLPPYSMVFMVIHGMEIPACAS